MLLAVFAVGTRPVDLSERFPWFGVGHLDEHWWDPERKNAAHDEHDIATKAIPCVVFPGRFALRFFPEDFWHRRFSPFTSSLSPDTGTRTHAWCTLLPPLALSWLTYEVTLKAK